MVRHAHVQLVQVIRISQDSDGQSPVQSGSLLLGMDLLRDMPDDAFLDEICELYHELNMLHPFREGNGRTLRLFITLLVRNTGRDINFSLCDSDILNIATIKAAQGDTSMLRKVLEDIIEK